MRTYDLIYVISPEVAEEDSTQLQNDFRAMVTDGKAELVKEELWGRRKLAYEVDGFKDGVYVYLRIDGDATVINAMERKMRHSDAVIRYLSVRIDEDIKRAEKLAARRKAGKTAKPAAGMGEEAPALESVVAGSPDVEAAVAESAVAESPVAETPAEPAP